MPVGGAGGSLGPLLHAQDETLAALGWDEARAEDWTARAGGGLDPYRVVAVHRGRVVLHDGRAVPVGGAIERRFGAVAVGDWVAASPDGVIAEVLERRTLIRRGDDDVLAANVDLALIFTSANRDLNLRRAERLLALALDSGARAHVVLSKVDLVEDPEASAADLADRLKTPVLALSTLSGYGTDALNALLEPRLTVALLGSSGVGKSTLTNRLLGEERQRTLTIRESDDRGRHATVHRELFTTPTGALLVDTPGLRLPALAGDGGLAETFADVEELELACRFSNCGHTAEPGCAVRAAIEAGELDPSRLAARNRLIEEAEKAGERRTQRAAKQVRRKRE